MSTLPPELTQALDEVYGPISATFTVNQVPLGGAPENIKRAWIGIPLPVREEALATLALGPIKGFDFITCNNNKIDEPVSITGVEAVHALNLAGQVDAANFWTPYQAGIFAFRAFEGALEPLQ